MKKRLFGRDESGRAVEEVVLESADAAVAVLSLGCVIRDWRVDGPRGSLPMVLGFPRLEDYLHHSRSHGAIVGRVANRTAGRVLHPRRRDLRAHRQRGREPPARRRHRPRQPHLGDGDRQRRQHPLSLLPQPRRRGGLPRRRRLRRHLPPRGPAAHLRDGRHPRPPDPDQPRQPQLLQPRRLRHGEGPPALGRRAATTPRPTPT